MALEQLVTTDSYNVIKHTQITIVSSDILCVTCITYVFQVTCLLNPEPLNSLLHFS